MQISNVVKLSIKLNRPIAIFDLECTTFRGRKNFGITEVAVAVISPESSSVKFSALINPEAPIDPDVVRLTGISNEMVASAEKWDARFSQFFKSNSSTIWFSGYNSNTFDLPAVKDMNLKYNQPISEFKYTFDVRQLYISLVKPESKKGTLAQVAALLGVTPSGTLHRAEADVALTVEVLDALIEKFGLDMVYFHITKKDAPVKPKLDLASVTAYLNKHGFTSIDHMASSLKVESSVLSFELGGLLDEKLIPFELVAIPDIQAKLTDIIVEIPNDILYSKKLKPIFEYIRNEGSVPELDFTQLRIALNKAGISWSSLKP